MGKQKNVRGFRRKVKGRKRKVNVRGHRRIKRTDIKKKGIGR